MGLSNFAQYQFYVVAPGFTVFLLFCITSSLFERASPKCRSPFDSAAFLDGWPGTRKPSYSNGAGFAGEAALRWLFRQKPLQMPAA
jgi:hypothetical protein